MELKLSQEELKLVKQAVKSLMHEYSNMPGYNRYTAGKISGCEDLLRKLKQPPEEPITQALTKLQDGTAEWHTHEEVFDEDMPAIDCTYCNWSRSNNFKVCTWCKSKLK